MSLEVFNAYVEGYGDRLFDQHVLAVQAGYWAGYYNRAKHPKSIKSVLTSMLHKRQQTDRGIKTPAPEVDVEAYLEMERKFQERMHI